MKKRHYIIPFVALSLSLAACQADGAETDASSPVPSEQASDDEGTTTDPSSSEITEDEEIPTEPETTDPNYALLEQAKDEYHTGELDAAAGTLSLLLQNDLSDNELLQAEAEDLKAEISQQQAENAKEAAESQAETAYPQERQSSLLSEEYEAAGNESIEEATDAELEAWLAEKEAQADEPVIEEVEEEINEEAESEEQPETTEKTVMTKEEAENYAFEHVLERAELEGENYFYFVNHSEESWVQVEARESVEQDGVTFSNLIGIYRYNVETDDMQKLDIVTGEYNTVPE